MKERFRRNWIRGIWKAKLRRKHAHISYLPLTPPKKQGFVTDSWSNLHEHIRPWKGINCPEASILTTVRYQIRRKIGSILVAFLTGSLTPVQSAFCSWPSLSYSFHHSHYFHLHPSWCEIKIFPWPVEFRAIHFLNGLDWLNLAPCSALGTILRKVSDRVSLL